MGLRIAHLPSEQLRRYETRLGDVALKGVIARLAGLILFLVESEGVVCGRRGTNIPIRYTSRHSGTMVGASREQVTRSYTQLKDDGAVELRRRLIW